MEKSPQPGSSQVKRSEGLEDSTEKYPSDEVLETHSSKKRKIEDPKTKKLSRRKLNQHYPGKYAGLGKSGVQCDICFKYYASASSLHGHKALVHPIKCEHCDETLKSKASHYIHLVESHKYLQCKICIKSFATEHLLENHSKCHIKKSRNALSCVHCDEDFDSKVMLIQHCTEKHPKERADCYICGELLEKLSDLANHMNAVHKHIQCEICFKFFSRPSRLRSHQTKVHNVLLPNDDQDKPPSNRPLKKGEVKCRHCPEILGSEGEMDSHLATNHKKCELCPKYFANYYSLWDHMYAKHPIKCEHCDEQFKSRLLLKRHCKEKHQNNLEKGEFQCDLCLKFYSSYHSLHHHKGKQHPLNCEHCDETFTSRRLLNQHISENHTMQGQKCAICNESLDNYELLQNHLVTKHNFKRCRLCLKTYSTSASLTAHMICIHNPLKCEYCRLHFTTKQKLVSHLNERHSSKRKKCEHCEEIIIGKLAMEQHVAKKHKPKKPPSSLPAADTLAPTDDSLEQLDEDDGLVDIFEIGSYECEECGEDFEAFHELELHNKKHILILSENPQPLQMEDDDDQLFECKICNLCFEDSDDLEQHSKEHIKMEYGGI